MMRRPLLGAARRSYGFRHASGTVASTEAMNQLYNGAPDIFPKASELRPRARGELSKVIQAEDVVTLWGHSTPGHPLAATPNSAVRLWLKAGFHPLLSLPAAGDLRATDDALGTDLSSKDPAVLKDSIAVWTNIFNERHLRAQRLARQSGASQIGLIRDTPVVEDEADNAGTTWAQDKEFLRAVIAVRDALQDKPANLEQLELALRRAPPDVFAALIEAGFPGESPHPYAPIPTSARWHYSGDALKEWAIEFQTARQQAEPTLAALRSAVDRKNWQDVANTLANKLQAVNQVLQARRKRQADSKLRTAWATTSAVDRTKHAEEVAKRFASGVLQGEFDVEESFDTTEMWIEEHERISSILDEPLDGTDGLTFKKVWLATTRLEALENKHLYTSPAHLRGLAACFRRALDEDGAAAIEEANVAVLRGSTFTTSNGDLVPDAATGMLTKSLPAVWMKVNWWRFCGAGVRTQHTSSGARQFNNNYARLSAAPGIVALHYALRPLSQQLDYGTPYKLRRSIARALTSQALAEQRAGVQVNNDLLRNLYRVEDSNADIAAAVAWPIGVERRRDAAVARSRLQVKVFPVTDVAIAPAETHAEGRKALGVDDTASWLLGSTRKVTFKWEPLQNLRVPAHTNSVTQALERERAYRQVGIEVSLWRRTSRTQTTESEGEAQRVQRVAKLLAAVPSMQGVAQQIAWDLSRIAGTEASIPSDIAVAEGVTGGYEFVGVLDDNHPGTPDESVSVHLPHVLNAQAELKQQGTAVEPGTYRLRLRCFQHDENPQHEPTLVSEAYSGDFQVNDVLPTALAQANATDHSLPSGKFLDFFEALRSAGLTINTALEFECGQSLTPAGDAVRSRLEHLIRTGAYAPIGTKAGITTAQLTIEPRVKRHWMLTNPGATAEEWQGARRFVLERAIVHERDWWYPDETLDADADLEFDLATESESRQRYGQDYVSILEATGESGTHATDGSLRPSPLVRAAYSGAGHVTSLQLSNACADSSLDEVLRHCVGAVDSAHVRLNTLAASRLNSFERRMRYAMLDDAHHSDFGGIQGATYRECYRRAVEQVDGDVGGSVLKGLSTDARASSSEV
jgi:hypothetical protein